MAVGSRNQGLNGAHNKAEMFFNSTSSWKTKASYPFHEAISAFEIIAHSDSFILFGGLYNDEQVPTDFYPTDIVAKFNPGSSKWTKLGNLRHSRYAFGITEVDTKYMVIGGQDDKRTETCELKNETIECTSREPTLNEFRYYPALMIVSSDYADNC